MRISHKHKFIYFANPKAGSTSIRRALDRYSDIRSVSHKLPYNHHGKVELLRNHFLKKGWDWDLYYKFTSVRNPWSRTVSLWTFGKKKKIIPNCFKTFQSWVLSDHRWLNSHWGYDGFYRGKGGEVISNNIIKTETLQKDFNIVCDEIGIPRKKLPYTNKTNHKHYTEYYDDETRQIVAEKYAKDIEYFGYEFGE